MAAKKEIGFQFVTIIIGGCPPATPLHPLHACSDHLFLEYRMVGIFRGGKFSLMLKLLLACGKNFVDVVSRLCDN